MFIKTVIFTVVVAAILCASVEGKKRKHGDRHGRNSRSQDEQPGRGGTRGRSVVPSWLGGRSDAEYVWWEPESSLESWDLGDWEYDSSHWHTPDVNFGRQRLPSIWDEDKIRQHVEPLLDQWPWPEYVVDLVGEGHWSDSEGEDDSPGSKSTEDSHKHGPKKHKHGSRERGRSSWEHSRMSRERGHGSREHSHRSRERGHGSREHSHRSGERSSEGWDSSEEDNDMNTRWCFKYCMIWIDGHFLEVLQERFIFSLPVGSVGRETAYCRAKCAEQGVVVEGTTPPAETTTEAGPQFCHSCDDCSEGECCALAGHNNEFGLPPRRPICQPRAAEGETCPTKRTAKTLSWSSGRPARVFKSCPCQEDLECTASEHNSRSRGSWRNSARKVCRRPEGWTPTTTITTSAPETTTARPQPTTPETTVEPEVVTVNVTLVTNHTDGRNESTGETDAVHCESHMDCPLFLCCINKAMTVADKEYSGICQPFAAENQACLTRGAFVELPVLSYCPCQTSSACTPSDATPDGAYGTCSRV